MELLTGELLLYIGAAIMGITVIGAVIALVMLHVIKKRLDSQLESEYGRRRHR